MQRGRGQVGLIHVDAHADVNEHMFNEQIAHGTPPAVPSLLLYESRVLLLCGRLHKACMSE